MILPLKQQKSFYTESKYEKLTNEHEQVRPLKLIKSGMQEITCVEDIVLRTFYQP